LAVTLFSFEQVYAEGDYFGPALLGMLLAMGVAVGARRLGISTGLTLLVSTLGLVTYLGVVFATGQTLYGVPTPSALAKLWEAVTRAYDHSQIDYAPVPLRPGYALLTVVGMWYATTIGEIATFRWRRPLAATLGPTVLFSVLLILGTRALAPFSVAIFLTALFTYWGMESSHRLRSWGRWVPTWSEHEGRTTNEPNSVTGGLARRLGAACVAAALVTPLFTPAIENGLLSFRSGRGDGPGFGTTGVGGVVDPLVSIVPELITQTATELFRVNTEDIGYWRLVTLTNFDGQSWTPGSAQHATVADGQVPLDLVLPNPSKEVNLDVEITGLRGTAIPMEGLPNQVQLEADSSNIPLTVDMATGDVETQVPIHEGFRYSMTGLAPDPSYKDLKKASIGSTPLPALLFAPVSERVAGLAQQWTRNATTPFEKLLAIQAQLRQFSYSLDVEPSSDSNYLDTFLFETKMGYCQQFATAFALLARTLGFPTRVVVGFLPGTSTDEPNVYSVRGTDTHAWPEVYFEGLGWIPFEPTPRGEAPPPLYTIAPGEEPVDVRFAGGEVSIAGGKSGRNIESLERGAVGRGNRSSRVLDPPTAQNGSGAVNRAWRRTFARVVLVLLALVLLFLIAVPALKQLRIRGAYRRASDPRSRAAAAFREFELEAGELATPRSKAESAAAYAARVSDRARVPRDVALRLAWIYEAAEYAPAPIDAPAGVEAEKLARQLRARLWAHASWWARVQRLFSPAALLSRA
jgi:transglutaminase-like putative cysteine protease